MCHTLPNALSIYKNTASALLARRARTRTHFQTQQPLLRISGRQFKIHIQQQSSSAVRLQKIKSQNSVHHIIDKPTNKMSKFKKGDDVSVPNHSFSGGLRVFATGRKRGKILDVRYSGGGLEYKVQGLGIDPGKWYKEAELEKVFFARL